MTLPAQHQVSPQRESELRDELDKAGIEQLHKVVLQISANCFELKKLCATVLVSVGTLIATFTARQLDYSLYIAGGLIAGIFWVLDAQSYYYQAKIRARMKEVAEELMARRGPRLTIAGVGMPVQANATTKGYAQARRAAFNSSMLFYLFVLALMGVLATAHAFGALVSAGPSPS
jgi:hypothetical protein